jgi:predicted phosphodiesterase
VKALHAYIAATKPDSVLIIGDFMDYPQPSRWSKDSKAEFEGSVFRDSEMGKRMLGELRAGYDGSVQFIEGNHDARPRQYLAKYAPALAESKAFNVETLLDFAGHGVELVAPFFDVAPGWIATHGHLKLPTSRIPAVSARLASERLTKSVVMGHTHKLGLSPWTRGTASRPVVRWGMEVGNVMDMRKAQYLGYAAANWQGGFGMLHVDGNRVSPEVIPLDNSGGFIADGKVWTS